MTEVARKVAFAAVDLNYEIAKPYIPSRFIEEMQGIHDGSNGVADFLMIRRINFLPEIIKAQCTIAGAFGPATKDGNLLHLRALDWDHNAPVDKYPGIIIYEPTEQGSHTFANIGFLGLTGILTGMAKNGVSIGEKVMYPTPGAYPVEPTTTYVGKPWMFVLKDALQFATTQDDVYNQFKSTKRTAALHLGAASVKDNSFRIYDYAANMLMAIDDKNYTHYSNEHPQLDGIVFYDKGV